MKKGFLLFIVFFAFYQNLQAQDFFNQITGCSPQAVAADESGNMYVMGYFGGTLTIGTTTLESAGSDDIFIAKYNAAGALQWAKRAGGTLQDYATGIAVSGNAVYITGGFQGTANFNTPSATGSNEITSLGSRDIYLAKYDDAGNFQWVKRAGGTGDDFARGVAVSGNAVYITGIFQATANFNTPTGSQEIISAGGNDIFIAKYDDTGACQWAKRSGGTGSDSGYGVAASGTSVYITGSFQSTANFNNPSTTSSNQIISAGGQDIFLAKYDDTGAFLWAKRGGSRGSSPFISPDFGYSVAVSGTSVYITGYFQSTANFNNPSATGSNEITAAGSNQDIFLAKFDDAGAFQWAKRAGTPSTTDFGFGVAASGSDVYIIGSFAGTANFNTPSVAGSNEITSVGNSDIFFAKYDGTGAFQWAKRAGGTGSDNGYGIAVSGSKVYLVGTFSSTFGFVATGLTCAPSVSVTANPSGTISAGTSVTFTATPTNGGTPTYQWEKNNVVVGTNSATYTDATLANNDVIKCVLTSTEVCAYNVQSVSSDLTMSVSGVLPVELLSFSGKNTEGGNLLTWTTAHEVNNKGFQIERAPQPPKGALPTWEVLGFVNAKSKAAMYDFADKAPFGGWGLYRLRQIDNDGKETLSKIISISTKGSGKLKVYPNPVSNVLTVEFVSPLWGLGAESFQIFNFLGQEVMTGKATSGGWGLDVSALPEGTYVLKVGAEQVKFIKKL